MCMELTPWEKCVQFHGHECGGLTIGYKAATYVKELFGFEYAEDEELVCISENDACGVDAIQVLLGCSIGKGNLLFHMTGKQAFNFFDKTTGKSTRLVLKPRPEGLSKEENFKQLQEAEAKDLFYAMRPSLTLPEAARIFSSHKCDCCGEMTGDNWLKVVGGKYLCLDCYKSYDRFKV